MSIHFPCVTLDNGKVTLYGVFHGLKEGDLPSREWLDSAKKEAEQFRDTDYFLVEGYPTSGEDKLRFLFGMGIVPGRAESRPEFYDALLFDRRDLEVDSVYSRMLSDISSRAGNEISKESGSRTSATMQEVEDIKRTTIDAMRDYAPRIPKEDIAGYIEKLFTVRSLLLSRTCEHRLNALAATMKASSDVRSFQGFIHAAEMRRFLEDRGLRECYARQMDKTSMEVYELNESVQSKITDIFRDSTVGLPVRPRLLRAIAYSQYDKILSPRGIPVYSSR